MGNSGWTDKLSSGSGAVDVELRMEDVAEEKAEESDWTQHDQLVRVKDTILRTTGRTGWYWSPRFDQRSI